MFKINLPICEPRDSIAGRWCYGLALVLLGLIMLPEPTKALSKNGFDLDDALIPADQIRQGGPPRDGIPAILAPRFEAPADAPLWQPDDIVLTVSLGDTTRAYPVGILNWHELVNDEMAGMPLLVSFCPLCGTGMVFDRRVGGRQLTFGVSGLLYNSDLLMYDHQTESLWSQIHGRAVAGPLAGQTLERIPVRHERWGDWRQRVGDGAEVLSTATGHSRDYRRSPYGDYDHSERLYFPVSHRSQRYHPKTWVLGWSHNGEHKAWPFPELDKAGATVADSVGGQAVVVHYDPAVPAARLLTPDGEELAATQAFWFAWYTFHPDTGIFTAE